MYKDGMSISEVTCYFYASATYGYSHQIAHSNAYTHSGAAHGYPNSNSDICASRYQWPDRVQLLPRLELADIRDERRRLQPDQPHQQCRR